MRYGLTFDDVCLVPCYSNVESRLDPDTSTWLTKDIKVNIPLINSPMDTVISFELADVILKKGGMPIFNRSKHLSHYQNIYKKYRNTVFVSTCVNDLDEIKRIIDLGFDKILLDTANGHTLKMCRAIECLKRERPIVSIMAGNVATAQGYQDLCRSGVDCVRTQIGSGAACTTREVTGVGVPSFTCVRDCYQVAKKLKVPFVSDGGISNSRHMCIALAAGACTVMAGKLFAATEESAAKKKGVSFSSDDYSEVLGKTVSRNYYEPRLAKYRGQASEDFQKDHYGAVKKNTVPEGECFWTPVTGSASQMIDNMVAGLRSSMTYLGAKTIKEYQEKAEFMQVSPVSYKTESGIRKG